VSDRDKITRLIAGLAAMFNREADVPMFDGYYLGLADLPMASIERAVQRAIREAKFMPSVAELREMAGVMLPADRVVAAWGVFARAATQHGYYTSVSFDDPLINATVRNLGGWIRVSDLKSEEFDKWFRQQFEKVYLTLLRTGASAEAAAPLTGWHDQQNGLHGYTDRIQQPLRIACDLPPHREGLIRLPAAKHPQQNLLTQAAASVGRETKDVDQERLR